MAFLEIEKDEINLSGYEDPYTGKTVREIDELQLREFNRDLKAIAAQYASDAIRAALDKYKQPALQVARVVMYRTAQPYGGANSLGQEIVMRMIKPVDMNYGVLTTSPAGSTEEHWDIDLSGETVGDIWGFQTGGTTPADDVMTRNEGNLIVGFADPVPLNPFGSYQVIKGGRNYPYYTLTFTPCAIDQIKFLECMSPIAEYPEDNVRIQMDVARAQALDRLQAIGLHFCRASDITSATGSGGS